MSEPAPRAPVTADPLVASPLIEGRHTDAALGESLLRPVLGRPGWGWWALVGLCSALTVLLVVAIGVTLFVGVGTWGNNIPVAWAFGIINFVWWIGIGHAGTLISAILLLFGEKWRSSVNRMAEAMTLFAVGCAGAPAPSPPLALTHGPPAGAGAPPLPWWSPARCPARGSAPGRAGR